jgi:DNA modification methylase
MMIPDYQLWLGDCLEEMSRIEDGSIDMILADLPYGTTACKWDVVIPFEPLWKQYKRVIKRSGAIVLTASQPFSSLLVASNLDWFKYEWVWDKQSKANFMQANYQPLKTHENILVFSASPCTFVKGGIPMQYNPQKVQGYLRKSARTVYPNSWRDRTKSSYPVQNIESDKRFPVSILPISNAVHLGKTHPTQKPVTLLSYLINTYTNPGELVLDNTCGSGSTLEAAMRTERRSIGIEKDLNYYQIAIQRLERVATELRGEFKAVTDTDTPLEFPLFQVA